jgi:C1A family cysteine protease
LRNVTWNCCKAGSLQKTKKTVDLSFAVAQYECGCYWPGAVVTAFRAGPSRSLQPQGNDAMSKRLATILLGTFLAATFFVLPAWTQQTTPPAKAAAEATLPPTYDLRKVEAVTPIKSQIGGTCWTHGTMAAIESNLLLSGKWKQMGMTGIPRCSEYHLDWWNGFNQHANQDVDDPAKLSTGLKVHSGGDYKVAAAYISRGDGVIILPESVKNGDWHPKAPPKVDPSLKKLYVRDIEFFTMGDHLEGIEVIKNQIVKYGAMGTANKHGAGKSDNIHYQPINSAGDPNHSIAIIGWDDNKISSDKAKAAPKPGAWLIKNSHGEKAGENGYHWISYYDKHAARHPEMGAVTFRNIEFLAYDHIYYYDAHGWRDTLASVNKAFNAFKATGRETVKAVSFYTSAHNVNYTIDIYSTFKDGKLDGKLSSQKGTSEFCGFHTVDLQGPVSLKENDMFYVCIELSAGGHAIDRTSNIPVLLDQQPPAGAQPPVKKDEQPPKKDEAKKDAEPQKKGGGKGGKGGGGGGGAGKPVVASKASPGESYYWDGYAWQDLYNYTFVTPDWGVRVGVNFNHSANFCMKALAVKSVGP